MVLVAAEPSSKYTAIILEVIAERENVQDKEMTTQSWEELI